VFENSVAIGGSFLWIICDSSFFRVYSPVNIREPILIYSSVSRSLARSCNTYNKMYVGVCAPREVHNSMVADSPGSF
jgi:hypothetical protein